MVVFAVDHDARSQRAQGLLVKLADFFGQFRVDGIAGFRFRKEFHLVLDGFQSVAHGLLHGRQAAQLGFELDEADGVTGEFKVE